MLNKIPNTTRGNRPIKILQKEKISGYNSNCDDNKVVALVKANN